MTFSFTQKRRSAALPALLCLTAAAAAGPARAQTFTNPIVTGLNPGVADPFITYWNNTYYLTGTSTSGNITIYASPSLATLGSSGAHFVYNVGHFFESPEMYTFNGLWYIYYTDGIRGIYVLESDSSNPLGSYHYKAQLTNNTYDGSLIQMPGGGLYLIGCTADANHDIVIQPLSNPYSVGGGQSTICVPDQSWENGVTEAPNPVWHSGQLDILYSGGQYNASNYGCGLLRFNGGDPTNRANWTKLSGPMFTQNAGNGDYDVGVASPFLSPDGTQMYCVFGDYNTSASNPADPNRTVLIQPMAFDFQDNPILGTPVPTGWSIALPPGDPNGPSSVINTGMYYRLMNENSGKVAAVSGQSTSPGAQITQWDDNGTPDHNWKLVPIGNGYYHIVNQNSGLLLAVSGQSTADSANVTQWTDNGTPDHNWRLESMGGGYYHIVNQNSQKLLAVNNASTADGAYVQQYHDNGTEDHNWILVPVGTSSTAIVPGAYYSLTNAAGGDDLDDPSGTNVYGTLVQLWQVNGQTPQNWRFDPHPDGSFTLTNQASGILLDNPGGNILQGTLLQLYGATGATAQAWRVNPLADGNYTFTNLAANLMMDDPGGTTQWGTHVQLWPANNSPAQEWQLTRH